MPLGGSVGDFDWHVPGVERISDEHWFEIVEVHPSLELLEEAVADGVGEWAALNFRAYAIEQLQCGELQFAGPVAMDRVLRDVELRRQEGL